jgi:hypothetical protein
MFFGESGSIAGGQISTLPAAPSTPGGTYCGTCQTDASYSRTKGTRCSIASSLGAERSMWQRQIQVAALFGTCLRIAAGCGSWTMITSQSPEISVALSSL